MPPLRASRPVRRKPITVSVNSALAAVPRTVPICPADSEEGGPSARARPTLVARAAALPVLERFCRRSARQCAQTDAMLRTLAHTSAAAPPLVHIQVGRQGGGFGAVLQEKAGLLLLALATRRPVLLWTDSEVFNSAAGGALFSPPALEPSSSASPVRVGLPSSVGFDDTPSCEAFVKRAAPLLPYRCIDLIPGPQGSARSTQRAMTPAHTRVVPRLEDGLADTYIKRLKADGILDRWAHRRLMQPLNTSKLFPDAHAVAFGSPSVTLAFAHDLLRPTAPATSEGERALALAAEGAGEFSGSRCLVRHFMRRAGIGVLRSVLATLAPTAVTTLTRADGACTDADDGGGGADGGRGAGGGGASADAALCAPASAGALLVGVHIRRGDRAVHVECAKCVNEDDPDSTAPPEADRISMPNLIRELGVVNASLARYRRALGRDVLVFAASDTVEGLSLVRATLSETTVLSVRGRAVHSTRTSSPRGADSVKVAADFLALSLCDVLFSIGSSSFSGNAAAVGSGVLAGLPNQQMSSDAAIRRLHASLL